MTASNWDASRRLTIFEGVDGSGKTTAAQEFAARTGAVYVHFGPAKHISHGLMRLYVEGMLPALMGYQDVVFDRSWFSEIPYADVYRGGARRMSWAQCGMMTRLALRCATVLVHCDPGEEAVLASFRSGRDEYLEHETQVLAVRQAYEETPRSVQLPTVKHDYTSSKTRLLDIEALDAERSVAHRLAIRSAGNRYIHRAVLVGEAFADIKEHDALYQWPFGSASRLGCSYWLTEQLHGAGINETDLLWVNADQDLDALHAMLLHRTPIFALGASAEASLAKAGLPCRRVHHPQAVNRFGRNSEYELITALKELIK